MRAALLVASLAVAGVATAAPARDLDAGRAHFAAGSAFFKARRFAEAIGELLEAYRLTNAADLLYNIGACYEALDDPGRATIYFQRYLDERPDAPERADVEAALYRMSSRVGRLVVRAPSGAEVLLDGSAVEIAPPAPLPVSEGRHRLEARRDGKPVAAAEVKVVGKLSSEVRLEPSAAAAAGGGRTGLIAALLAGGGAIVVGAVVAVLLATLGTDERDRARAVCAGQPGCAVIDLTGAR
jgi:tetratricopeptide (TPR) repeat protein